MIELNREQADKLYEEIREILLSKKDEKRFEYNKMNIIYTGFYNEIGKIEYENIDGKTIIIEINRWHNHQHNGFRGINASPCLKAKISLKDNEEIKKVFELKVTSGTMFYKAEATSLDLPKEILKVPIIIQPIEESFQGNIEFIQEVNEETIEFIEKRNLLEEIKELQSEYKNYQVENDKIINEREKEIETAIQKIETKYSKKIKQNQKNINSVKKKKNSYEKLFIKYSTINVKLISNILPELISIIEGDKFTYQETKQKTQRIIHGAIDSWTEDFENEIKIIIRESKKQDYYSSDIINKLIEEKDAILLSEDISYSNEINFYSLIDNEIGSKVKYGNFNYVKDLVDFIIQNRYQYDNKNISKKDIVLLMKQIINKYQDTITKNYTEMVNNRVLKLENKS